MNASVTRKSGDTSSTHIIDEVLKTARIIVLENTSTTSAASMTLRSAMTAASIASSHAGAADAGAAPSAGSTLDDVVMLDACVEADSSCCAASLPRVGAVIVRGTWGRTLAVRRD